MASCRLSCYDERWGVAEQHKHGIPSGDEEGPDDLVLGHVCWAVLRVQNWKMFRARRSARHRTAQRVVDSRTAVQQAAVRINKAGQILTSFVLV